MESEVIETADTPMQEIFESEIDAYLQYKMICTRDPFKESDTLCNKVYSIIVLKLREYDVPESFFLYDVSRSYEKAMSILNCLRNNAVTPCIAGNVLQDII